MKSMKVFFVICLLALSVNGMIHKLKISGSDDRKAILIGDFGFNEGGKLTINFKNNVDETASSSKINFSIVAGKNSFTPPTLIDDSVCSSENAGFATIEEHLEISFNEKEGNEYLKNHEESHEPMSDITKNYLPPGYYYVFVVKCEQDDAINAEIDWDAHNINSRTGAINYLSAGRIPLTWVSIFFAIVWVAFSSFWIVILLKGRKKANRVHIFLACFFIFYTISYFFDFGTYIVMGNEGSRKAMGFFFFFFTIVRGLLFFLIIVIIGTGLSFIKRHLRRRELLLIISVVVLQVLANIAYTVYENRPKTASNRTTWMAVFRIADLVCCCCVVIPIIWSLNTLRKKADSETGTSQEHEQEQKSITKLRLFQRYYLLVIGFVYIRIILVYLISLYVEYYNEWTIDLVKELLSLGFYGFIVYLFRPEAENPFIEYELDDYVAPTLVDLNDEPAANDEEASPAPTQTQNTAILVGDDEIVIEE